MEIYGANEKICALHLQMDFEYKKSIIMQTLFSVFTIQMDKFEIRI